jgi:hypothetical protein
MFYDDPDHNHPSTILILLLVPNHGLTRLFKIDCTWNHTKPTGEKLRRFLDVILCLEWPVVTRSYRQWLLLHQ